MLAMSGGTIAGVLTQKALATRHTLFCRVACSVRPGRLQVHPISSAAASLPFPLLGGSRTKSIMQPPTDRNSSLHQRTINEPASGGSPSVPSGHQQQHVSAKPFVLGSPPDMLGGSHTQPANSGIAAHGCYRVIGPARISKRGDCLVARLLPGSRLELLSSGGACASSVEAVPTSPSSAQSATHSNYNHHNHHNHHHGGVGAARSGFSAEAAAAGTVEWGEFEGVQCACTRDRGSDGCDSEWADDGSGSGGEEAEEDGAVAECVLVASYVELGGSACSVDLVDKELQCAVHHHNGHTYLSVRNLPSSATIILSSDGDLSHPVNVTPPPPSSP